MTLGRFFNDAFTKSDEHSPVKDKACIFPANMPITPPAITSVAYKPEAMTDDEYTHCKTCGDDLTNGEKDRGYCADCWSKMG